jgi:hypothetical protein
MAQTQARAFNPYPISVRRSSPRRAVGPEAARVAAAQNAADRAAIEAFIAQKGVTRCPTRFAVKSSHAFAA